ncbi:ATP-binding protein [Desulfopila inferna]|uniref:ATP-binding protein n=1 Tax=Desulfopila inferna TaxID=468528 RepID=UPI0019659733|nr:4Fe-4S dicluster domain-containing protein [Desulfopila inferna]MBM9605822.1 4Fe-4S ferredoxin [Desulfopila inferna]
MKNVRKIIQIDEELCDGCGQCVPDCAEGSLVIVDGKAKLVEDKLCDGLGACLGACPQGALKIIEREAEEFDEEAVEEYLAAKEKEEKQAVKAPAPSMGGGCPSARLQNFAPQTSCQAANVPVANANTASALTHWPIQIRLIPPTAPFLKNADVLIAADCTAVAVPGFQEKYLQNKVVMMGCPKFDDAQGYIDKFADIITTAGLNSITILIVEVPCCSSMNVIVKKAMEKAGKTVPVEQITVSTRGGELERKTW